MARSFHHVRPRFKVKSNPGHLTEKPMAADGLLAPDEPAPVRVLREGGASDYVFTADHGGRRIPRRLGDLGISEADQARHIAWDIGIAGVTERLSTALDAAAALQTYSRLVIDCNRDPSWPSAMPLISELTEIPGNKLLTDVDRNARIDEIFRPYHDRIEALLDARVAAGRRSILVAMHSFTPVFKGEARAIEVGVLYFRQTKLAEIMLDLLRREGDLSVGENAPYALTADSDYSVPFHAERRGLEHVEIEIRQDLIETPEGQAAWAERFARLLKAARPGLG
jgi:predicted N-formylglutamate amidohydrolase